MKMMTSALTVSLFLCAASAAVLDATVRQGGGGRPAARAPGVLPSIGSKKYLKRAMSPGVNCPKNITHGLAGTPPFGSFDKYGIEAAMNFSEITIDGTPCTGDQNDTAYMAVLSDDELKRMLKVNPLGVNERDSRRIVVAGIDTQKRKCGDYNAAAGMMYFFTQDIGVLTRALSNRNIKVDTADVLSGDKWMIATDPSSKGTCVYVDENAVGISDNTTEASAEPVAPVAPVEPAEPLPIAPGTTALDVSPQPDATNNGGSVCFPSSATVQLEDGTFKTMDTVELGDRVLVGSGKFSEVYMFTHKLSDTVHEFVNLKTSGAELSLTASHYIYVNGQPMPAGSAKVGDTLECATGNTVVIEAISTKMMTGLFNPQTVHGDIVVDGVRASTYTTVAQPKAAHAMLAPLRSLYNKFGWSTAALDAGNDMLAMGASKIVA